MSPLRSFHNKIDYRRSFYGIVRRYTTPGCCYFIVKTHVWIHNMVIASKLLL